MDVHVVEKPPIWHPCRQRASRLPILCLSGTLAAGYCQRPVTYHGAQVGPKYWYELAQLYTLQQTLTSC